MSEQALVDSTRPPSRSRALRTAMLRGSAAEVMGFGLSQLIRFGSNLLLSRMLFPEAFGLAALVNILNQGLIMLSDVGLPTIIVQSERGDDLRFLNTAFTWQFARGVVLFVIASACAVPMALIYNEPLLDELVPFGALSVLVLGLRSTAYYTLRRKLNLFPLVVLEIASQAAAVLAMVLWASWDRSVWALVMGSVMSSVVATGGSHLLRVGYRNKFMWDKESAQSMMSFGKWVAGSSMLTFASQQGDRLLLGRFLGAAQLGIYSIAVFLSSALGEGIGRITHGVFFPAYSRVKVEGKARLSEVFYRTRLVIDGLVIPALAGLSVLGPAIVHLLYGPPYYAAGWMLRVLAVRVVFSTLIAPYQFCLFAIGESGYGFFLNLARTIAMLVFVPIGYSLHGVEGLVWCVTLSELPALVVVYIGFARHGLASPTHEARVPAFYAAGLALGYLVLLGLRHLGFEV